MVTPGTSPGGLADNIARAAPPGDFETGRWYYVAHVFKSPTGELQRLGNGDPVMDENGFPVFEVDQLGSQNLYLYDGTMGFSDEKQRDAPFFNTYQL